MALALEGIKVLDFTRHIAGPTCTQFLGDLGADVMKVEGLPLGDGSRETGPFQEGECIYFLSANRNKRDIALNLQQEGVKEVLWRLATQVDVIVENFRPGVLKAMGLDYDELKKVNPKLILCSISGYGSTGPGRDLPGFDQIAQGMSGLMSITGSAESGPMRVGLPIGDIGAGLQATIAILAAIVQRQQTGQGQIVETSLLQTLVSMLVYQGQKFLSLGEVAKGQGNDHPITYPHGTFRTKDIPMNISAFGPKMWVKLCKLLNIEEYIEHPKFKDNTLRMQNREELRAIIEERLATKTAAEWVEIINAAGIPCGPILNIDDVYAHPQVQHLGLIQETQHPVIGPLKVGGMGVRLQDSPQSVRHAPPMLGQHTAEILREAGFSEAEIEQFTATGVAQQYHDSVKTS